MVNTKLALIPKAVPAAIPTTLPSVEDCEKFQCQAKIRALTKKEKT